MKTMQQWFDEYAESHQNETNKVIHIICVPAIYFAISGLLLSIDSSVLQKFGVQNSLLLNWATLASVFVMIFYIRLSFSIFVKMFIFTIISLISNYYIAAVLNLFYFSAAVFVIAWIGQFYGHKVEGKKPSFFKDLQFLLIGPPWVFKKLFG